MPGVKVARTFMKENRGRVVKCMKKKLVKKVSTFNQTVEAYCSQVCACWEDCSTWCDCVSGTEAERSWMSTNNQQTNYVDVLNRNMDSHNAYWSAG